MSDEAIISVPEVKEAISLVPGVSDEAILLVPAVSEKAFPFVPAVSDESTPLVLAASGEKIPALRDSDFDSDNKSMEEDLTRLLQR